jgi:hypothetical protein
MISMVWVLLLMMMAHDWLDLVDTSHTHNRNYLFIIMRRHRDILHMWAIILFLIDEGREPTK